MKLFEKIPGVVMAWTMIFMAFTWTPTMRALLKPEISRWQVFQLGGSGFSLSFLVIPLLALYGLFLFYLYGRGKLRVLFHLLLLALHVPITVALLILAVHRGADARFIGAAWGFDISFAALSAPFILGTGLAIAWCAADLRGRLKVREVGWLRIGWKKLGAAAAMLPVAMIFFGMGENYNAWVKVAIVITIVQWITIAEALSDHPEQPGHERSGGGLAVETGQSRSGGH